MTSQSNGYSSTVCGWLIVNDQRHKLSEVGPDFCVLKSEEAIPAGDASIIIQIDDRTHTSKVRVCENGSPSDRNVVHFEDLG